MSSLEVQKLKLSTQNFFETYLWNRGIIWRFSFRSHFSPSKNDVHELSTFENPLKNDTLEYFIYTDDVASFVSYIAVNGIDLFERKYLFIQTLCYTISELVCFCGSINILKYLVVNNVSLNGYSLCYSVASGSEEMIQFLIHNGYSFDGTFEVAVRYHHNSIAKWLYDNYNNSYFNLPILECNFNTELFLFFF